jgi:hypothetical protein
MRVILALAIHLLVTFVKLFNNWPLRRREQAACDTKRGEGKFVGRASGHGCAYFSGWPGQFAVYPEYLQGKIIILPAMGRVEVDVLRGQLA